MLYILFWYIFSCIIRNVLTLSGSTLIYILRWFNQVFYLKSMLYDDLKTDFILEVSNHNLTGFFRASDHKLALIMYQSSRQLRIWEKIILDE